MTTNCCSEALEKFEFGSAALRQRQVCDAIRFYRLAERLGYPPNECAAALWQCWMLKGEFERAWQESDRIAQMNLHDPYRFWEGQPWHGKNVMLRCLHGLGDTIQFVRYATLLRNSARSVTAQVHPQLVRLIEGVAGIDRVITWEQPEGDWDLAMEVTELPRAFRTTIDSIPVKKAYIEIPSANILSARSHVAPFQLPRIGLAWQSGNWDLARCIPPHLFNRLLSSLHCEFYVLQKGVRACDTGLKIRDLEAFAADVLDTAALMLNLSLIISVDTMTAHLAGALGKPLWLLLPFAGDWRWMLDRTDSPWYPSARLFRQKQPDDWEPVIAEVQAELSALCG
jgi:hypothetical protein